MRLRALDRKLLRDALQLRGQVLACAAVVAIGVAAFVASYTMYRSLVASKDAYYARYRFAEVFASLERAPESLAERLRAIPGVAALQTRVVVAVNLDVSGLDEPARGRMVSLDAGGNTLNRLHLRRGVLPAPGHADEVAVSEAFAQGNGLRVGDRLAAVINGRLQRLTVTGIAISPEYIYEAAPGMLLPDPRRFGVLWMDRQALGAAFDMEGGFNEVSATLAPAARVRDVLDAFDRVLAPYGGVGSYDREDHFSNRFISDEITQNRVQSAALPSVFLAVGAFLLHTILARLVQLQRAQIGLLRAFGYGRLALVAHYLKLALVVMALGAIGGVLLALPLANWITRLYADFYRFPAFELVGRTDAIGIALAVVAAVAVLAAWNAALRAARLAPAEAMRPAPPPVYGLHAIDRQPWLARVRPGTRIVVRNLARRPARAALNLLGIALAFAVSILANYFYGAMDRAMELQFAVIQREDMLVVFNEPRAPGAGFDVARLPGVRVAEPFRALAVRVRHGHRSRRVELLGLEPAGTLRWIVDARGHRVSLPASGLLVNTKLAEILGLGLGDVAEVEVLEGERQKLALPVSAVVSEPLGLGVYVDRHVLARALGEDALWSGALLRVERSERESLYARLKAIPLVASVVIREAALRSFRDLLERSFLMLAFVNVLFAGTITFGMVYNGARIALSERSYELATLRVLGFSRGETARLLLGEQALLTAGGLPVGLALGAAASLYFSYLLTTELYRIPFVLTPAMVLQALAVLLGAAAMSATFVAWLLSRLDLIAVLKARE